MACWAFTRSVVGLDGGFLGLLVEELLGGLAGVLDDPGGFGVGLLHEGGALDLRGGELGLHLLGVLEAGADLHGCAPPSSAMVGLMPNL
jgi:hypothetical protein